MATLSSLILKIHLDLNVFDPEKILSSIFVCKIYNSSHLEFIIKNLARYLEEFRSNLVIIDSFISLHRAEYSGEEHCGIDKKSSTRCCTD